MIANKGVFFIKDLKFFKQIQSKYDLETACTEDTLFLFNTKNVVYFCDFLQEDRLTIGLLNLDSSKFETAILGLEDELEYDNGEKKSEKIRELIISDEVFEKIQLSSEQKVDELLFSLAFLNEKGSHIFSIDEKKLVDRVSVVLRNRFLKSLGEGYLKD
jgi:hypothetical protein